MYSPSLIPRPLRWLLPLAFLSTLYLYLYPVFHVCAFPGTNGSIATAFRDTFERHIQGDAHSVYYSNSTLAPFRLLVLADPQLEGDSSLPKPEDAFLSRLHRHWTRLHAKEDVIFAEVLLQVLKEVFLHDLPDTIVALRKRLDLFGNDYYLAHIFRILHWWTKPTHVTVLGDLLGSQWVEEEEFELRGRRYWNRVFADGVRVEDNITSSHKKPGGIILEMSDPAWKRRVINVVGNHDIGYAGDISRARLERFERIFGPVNWDVRFGYPDTGRVAEVQPTLHMVVLNDMILDTPALDEVAQKETYDYLNSVIMNRVRPVEDRSSFTLMLTHVPLHKQAGICVDSPFFDFWGDEDGGGVYRPHGLKEQNHLSDHASRSGMLETLFGMSADRNAPAHGKGRNGLILTGHDHEGCDTWHYIPTNWTDSHNVEDSDERSSPWHAVRWPEADMSSSHTGVREITLRSMMGEFGGNAGLLSAWFDFDQGEWKYDIQMCSIGVQHIWWAIHILDFVTLALPMLSIFPEAGTKPLQAKSIKQPLKTRKNT